MLDEDLHLTYFTPVMAAFDPRTTCEHGALAVDKRPIISKGETFQSVVSVVSS